MFALIQRNCEKKEEKKKIGAGAAGYGQTIGRDPVRSGGKPWNVLISCWSLVLVLVLGVTSNDRDRYAICIRAQVAVKALPRPRPAHRPRTEASVADTTGIRGERLVRLGGVDLPIVRVPTRHHVIGGFLESIFFLLQAMHATPGTPAAQLVGFGLGNHRWG